MTLPIETVPPDPAQMPPEASARSSAFPPAFRQLMVNSLVAGVTSTFLWFALTFWVYLETRSVVTTGVIAGTFSLVSAVVGPLIGTFVDHHRKHTSLLLTSASPSPASAQRLRSSTGTAPTASCSSTTRGSGCWSAPP
jgi:MFS transporter, DHA3 family, multidrug efflux protein